jgi:hypothetical protein
VRIEPYQSVAVLVVYERNDFPVGLNDDIALVTFVLNDELRAVNVEGQDSPPNRDKFALCR